MTQAKLDQLISSDLEVARNTFKKFQETNNSDLKLITECTELYKKVLQQIIAFRSILLITLEFAPGALLECNTMLEYGIALYYEEYLKNQTPNLAVNVLHYVIGDMTSYAQEIIGAKLVADIIFVNRLLSLCYQQKMQPLPALFHEVNVLRVARSASYDILPIYSDIMVLIDTFNRIDKGGQLRDEILQFIQCSQKGFGFKITFSN